MDKLVILADLGRVRALKVIEAGFDPAEQTHLSEIDEVAVEFHRPSLHETVTDQAGRFAHGGPLDRRQGMSYGEEHELEAEIELQAIHRIAQRIGEIVRRAGNPAWRLVAPRQVLHQVQAALPPDVAAALARTDGADLTGHRLEDLEHRFLQHP